MKKVIVISLVFIFIFCFANVAYAQRTTRIGESIDHDVNNDGSVNWLDKIALFFDPYVVGDADNDGDVDLTDYSVIRTYITKGYDGIDPQADVNEDGAIDAFDLFEVDKYITLGEQTIEY